MALFSSLILTLFSFTFMESQAQQINFTRILDIIIRDYTFSSYHTHKNFRTGNLHNVTLPPNLSGLQADSIRFRCGSLRRYGGIIKEFRLNVGVDIHPCTTRVILVRHKLGFNWSSLYYKNYEQLSGYRLVSPVLGLLAYNATSSDSITPVEAAIRATLKNPITIDFSLTRLLMNSTDGLILLCASFFEDGEMSLSSQARPEVCTSTRQGHFGLVVEAPLMMPKWKTTITGMIAVGLGLCLLGLLLIAVLFKAKKKATREEMERRAYEEEALQVSMVGHVNVGPTFT